MDFTPSRSAADSAQLQQLIVAMARANPTWGEERIANELSLNLGIVVSPRTVGRYRAHLHPPRARRQLNLPHVLPQIGMLPV